MNGIQSPFRVILPNILLFLTLIVATIVTDLILHYFDMQNVGRHLGFIGSLLILVSFLYSLRKRKIIKTSAPKSLLSLHETLGWIGSFLILIHAGIHFNAVLPWLALFFMMIVVSSGLVGKFLLQKMKLSLSEMQNKLIAAGKLDDEIEQELLFHSLTLATMKNWRKAHMPLTMIFVALALIHILTIFFLSPLK